MLAAPQWGFGDGEHLLFELKRQPHQMEVKCLDADEHDDDGRSRQRHRVE